MAHEVGKVVGLRGGRSFELVAGVTMSPLFGDGAMLNLLEFEAGAQVSTHDHPHEQLGYVVAGRLVLEIDGVEYELKAGDAYQIPGGTPHSASADGHCTVLDVFHPVRDDYREMAAQ